MIFQLQNSNSSSSNSLIKNKERNYPVVNGNGKLANLDQYLSPLISPLKFAFEFDDYDNKDEKDTNKAVSTSSPFSPLAFDFGNASMATGPAISADVVPNVLCAFIPCSSSSSATCNDGFTMFQDGFKRDDFELDKALNECNLIRSSGGIVQGLLLRCMDTGPKYKFLHFAVFDADSTTITSSSQHKMSRMNALVDELYVDNSTAEIGVFKEVFTIQKPIVSASLNGTALSTGRHAGYIVTCFKIYDEHYKQQALEKNWLTWTGAREIYKHSPRTWNLRKIALHRHINVSNSIRTFAYVLICEYGNILHPSNTLQALDMCERLRVRNCGHIALYQVRYNYGPSSSEETLLKLGVQRNRSMSHGQNISSPASPLKTSPNGSMVAVARKAFSSTHSPPSQCSNQYFNRVSPRGSTPTITVPPYWDYEQQSQKQTQANSPWSSPTMARKMSGASLAQRPLNATTSRRQMMQRGFSQDVDSAHETLRRRAALLRLRDASLGYDTPVALGILADNEISLEVSRGASAGSMIAASGSGGGTPPRSISPARLTLPNAAHRCAMYGNSQSSYSARGSLLS